MKFLLRACLIMPLLCSGILYAQQDPAEFFQRLERADGRQRSLMTDSFKQSKPVTPLLVQDTVLWFMAFGDAESMAVAGDPTQWKPAIRMKRIQGTDLWIARQVFPADARFEYKLVKNDQDYFLDPFNPHQSAGGFGANSEVVMPAYIRSEETLDAPGVLHQGTLNDTAFFSQAMNEERKITVYLPVGYAKTNHSFPVVFFNDGPDYIRLANILPVIDRIASGGLPFISVFIHPVKRDPEYSGDRQEAYTKYVIRELVPAMDSRFRILSGPENHVIAGISNGGNSALWIAVNHPDVFGRVAAHSSNIEKNVLKAFQKSAHPALWVYTDSGTYDLDMLKPMFDELKKILESKGFSHRAVRYHEGHNWGFWRNQTGNALRFLMQ